MTPDLERRLAARLIARQWWTLKTEPTEPAVKPAAPKEPAT